MSRTEAEPLPATAPWLLHSLRTGFDAKQDVLLAEAKKSCSLLGTDEAHVKFIYRCMEVTALYDRISDRFIELRACDIGEVGWEQPSYCITLKFLHTDQ